MTNKRFQIMTYVMNKEVTRLKQEYITN